MVDEPTPRRGGRAVGTPNRNTIRVFEILERLGYDPIEGMCEIATGRVLCFKCQDPFDRDNMPKPDPECETCKGTGREPVPLELRASMHKEVASYTYPKRRAVEHVVGADTVDGVPRDKVATIAAISQLLQ